MSTPTPALNIKREVAATLDGAVARISDSLKTHGFGILTRVDLHTKIKEKIGKDIAPTVILGACNPSLAHEAYAVNTDVTALLPCNVVVRELGPHHMSIECVLPSSMMRALGDDGLIAMASQADALIQRALDAA